MSKENIAPKPRPKSGKGSGKVGRKSIYTEEIGAEICNLVENGLFLREAAIKLGIRPETVSRWQDESRGFLVKGISFTQALARARQNSAEHWVTKATRVLEDAQDAQEIHKARELAHHYRWIAKMFNPARYSEKMQVEHSGAVEVEPKTLAPDWLLTKLDSMKDVTPPADKGAQLQLIDGAVECSPLGRGDT